ncbi:MAG: PEP-CTERM sorting domain-containing protein [Myxococcota bacterium]|nr:PEP-CTERM sorting domain-containing protein [Myxococcota bacterium]
MKSGRRILIFWFAVVLSVCLAGAAQAVPVRFLGVGDFNGFDPTTPGFPTTPDLQIEPSGLSLGAGPIGSGFDVLYTADHCLLPTGTTTCQPGVAAGSSYTDLVTITLLSTPVAHPVPVGGLYILFGGMLDTGYSVTDVWFDTDQQTVAGIPVDPLLYAYQASGDREYFGFLFSNIGDSMTVRYDVSAMQPSGTPILFTSAYYPVPEPGTAVLVALGLVGMACRQRL